MNLTKKQKLIRAIPGLIVGSIMTGIIIWGISSDNRCKKLLQKEDCKAQMVFSYESVKGRNGGSYGVATMFYLEANGEKHKIRTKGFSNPIVDGTPIIVRFSPQCPDCYEFLWDSAFVYKGKRYRYFYIEDEGYDFDITKVTN